MASFIPGSIKQPLNFIQGPEYPDIKKTGLRFVDAKKFWQVDAGYEIKKSEAYPFFMSGIITYETRNRNETKYGKSSHKSVVNEEVRYPLISPYDLLPISKQPRLPGPVHVNPGLTGYQIFQENMINEVYGHITDRVTYVPSVSTATYYLLS